MKNHILNNLLNLKNISLLLVVLTIIVSLNYKLCAHGGASFLEVAQGLEDTLEAKESSEKKQPKLDQILDKLDKILDKLYGRTHHTKRQKKYKSQSKYGTKRKYDDESLIETTLGDG